MFLSAICPFIGSVSALSLVLANNNKEPGGGFSRKTTRKIFQSNIETSRDVMKKKMNHVQKTKNYRSYSA